ncbi:carbon-monoxide dehydrogenase medium subunit/xanthine dehydrogenase FAD-binding subunit [Ilumatobacter fluminis]|uniref:Carbon-monoxide dehydrogenase medium subunit/xanthine dehydrogenase FAD-binding subunit n=1 Tax=Ilumatobacter fluminis TaxID=467091 RepID=A0A4R7HVY8_9ACTN|nr:FAD binding domain-containing protein [Ilumatobacter fluminis]TDT15217.1 carbon-monoxide dehydrogenase medium subunit/xanthine dehydrogenase FAD-binding subunit [Ilumatobacter fluminis]
MTFTIAATVDEALAALAAGARPVAGGSDLVVGARHGKSPLPTDLVAIDRIDGLRTIEQTDAGLRVGALVSHATLMTDAAVVGGYTGLADAAALVGSPATRHVGTLGGNVMNASPAMDTGAPLLVLEATAELRSVDGTREVPVGELWTGPGRTVATADELCTALVIPTRPDRSGSAYVRLEYRRAMEIAVVGAAASVVLDDDGSIGSLVVALSAVAPTIVSVDVSSLTGRVVDDALLSEVADLASERATPISDLRASDRYRRHTVGVMARRAVEAAARRARGEHITVPVNRAFGIGATA